MTQQERVAIARIVSDMIKADNIIEEHEIDMLNTLIQKYRLTQAVRREAQTIKFSDAVNIIRDICDKDEMQELYADIRKLTLADNMCVTKEALLLLAFVYCCKNDTRKFCKLVSCPAHETTLDDPYIVYIESEYDERYNEELTRDLELIVLKLKVIGFSFIYIPSVVGEFRKMNPEYVRDVIRYMAPDLSEETTDGVFGRLSTLSTCDFCRNILGNSLRVEGMSDTVPSLLINIGTSVIPGKDGSGSVQCYTEFLKITLNESIVSHIDSIVGFYKSVMTIIHTQTSTHGSSQFRYFGFYKALFDFLVKAQPSESKMIIHPYAKNIEFPDICKRLQLTPQEAAIYILIVRMTYTSSKGGLSTSPNKEAEKLFRDIYNCIAKNTCENVTLPYPVTQILAKIKKKIDKQLPDLANSDKYKPLLHGNKYSICLDPTKVNVYDPATATLVNIKEYWR